jgi:hypothetical protein
MKIKDNEVLLVFPSAEEKKAFLAGMSDGWGENIVYMDWDWKLGIDLYDASTVKVELIDEDEVND